MTALHHHHVLVRALLLLLLVCSINISVVNGFDFVLSPAMNLGSDYQIRLVDVTTNVQDIPTLFQMANASVHMDGLQWQSGLSYNTDEDDRQTARLISQVYIQDEIALTSSLDLSPPGLVPPSTVELGYLQVEPMGRINLTVTLQVVYDSYNNSTTKSQQTSPIISTQRYYQVYWPILTMVPVLVLVGFSYLTGNVEISISTANMVSVIIAQGDFFRGMEHLVYVGFLGALTHHYNGVIMLLVFFLSGIMSLIEVTGGAKGWVRLAARFISTTRVVQCLTYFMALGYFWDDVLSILVVGHLMRPLLDVAHTSRPLGAMILDATAGNMAGIVLISTWLVWEIPLLQQELSRIDALNESSGNVIPALQMTPWQVLQESLRYAFYPILYVILMPLLLWSQRHMGQILMYERITQVYQSKKGGPKDIRGPCQPNMTPPKGVPCRFWNALFPFSMITILFIVFWFQAGQRGAQERLEVDIPEQEEWIVAAYAYALTPKAWLQGISMGAFFFVISIMLQFQQAGNILFLPVSLRLLWRQHKLRQQQEENNNNASSNKLVAASEEEEEVDTNNEILVNTATSADDEIITTTDGSSNNNKQLLILPPAKPLLTPMDLIASFFFGFGRIMPYMIQFILAWALRTSFTEMGLDRWFASMLGDQLDTLQTSYIPIAAFMTAFLMSLATGGAARGEVASILLPMIVVPVYERTYNSTDADDMIFQVIGAVLSGCIAGDHAAPLSNTTLLSCVASDCHVLVHVITQIPYVIVVLMLSLLLGTGPVGYGIYPVGAGYFLGVVCLLFFVFFICYPILDPSGQWDIFTRLYIRCCVNRRRNRKNNQGSNDEEDPLNGGEDDDDDSNFWEILQRDTIRAANAIAHGLPYETEDCRHLMQPIDSAITKDDENDNAGRTSSSCEDDSDVAGDEEPPQLEQQVVEETGMPPPQPAGRQQSIEDHRNAGRPVRIIASDARGGPAPAITTALPTATMS
ncbi:Inherit from COG: Na H antiporter [Seminavis robusta]|uniref:Inherit from COG: Na H antiporter n=1 Tax=Seminavis robusta TaxID=568900 RepID=A0A9N8DT64_9STRA|nr:Inherit from COG: Na H antiporter [Seminavis robusta]|eukprot:Sro260_g101550.1 Inherit from COG: Na H antiporter (976) ;mRNA; f:33136-36063